MIAEEKIREAELMLARGKLSQRKIAKITGLSRGTISMIASGKRKVQVRTVDPDMPPEPEKSPPVRCPGCGAMVRMPCLLCFLKDLAERKRPIMQQRPGISGTASAAAGERHSSFPTVRLGHDLAGDELKRYKEVRAWRENCPNPYFIDIPEDWPWRK